MAWIASWQPRPGRNPWDLDSNRASHSGSSAFVARASRHLSAITGIPRPRRRPPGFGTYTRLTGLGIHAAARCCTQSANSALPWGSSTTFPSMPAVLRPAFCSVTRRTLSSVLARERSINLCRLRTLFRSPACDAAKILCLSRRTSSSTARQSIAAQSVTASSGPFATPTADATVCAAPPVCAAVASNLSLGSGVVVHRVLAGSPDPRQRPFRPGQLPLSGQLCGSRRGRSRLAAPVSCCLFGHRRSLLGSSCARWGVGPPSRSAYRANWPPGPHRGCCVAHEQDATGQGAPFTPGTAVRSQPTNTPRLAPAAFQRPVPTAPLEHPTGGGHLHEASSGVHLRSPITPPGLGGRAGPGTPDPVSPPVFSSPVTPGWNRGPWASSPGFAPRSYPRRTPRRRQAMRTGPGTTPSTSAELHRCLPLHSSTLTSHIVACCLHHHPAHPQLAQPVRQHQQRPRHRGVGPHLLQPPAPPALARHPDAADQLRLADIQRRDPPDDLLGVLRLLQHPASLLADGQQHGCPREPQGQAESDPRAQGDSDGPTARLPAPGCFPTSTITGLRRQRATSPIFTQDGRPSRAHGGCFDTTSGTWLSLRVATPAESTQANSDQPEQSSEPAGITTGPASVPAR